MLVVAALGAVALAAAPSTASNAAAAACVRIYEIYYNSPGTDTRTNTSLNGEWIRLHNYCSTSKPLTNFTIRDAAGHTYKFGTYTLKAYAYVRVHTGSGTNTSTDRYWGSGNYIWNNDKDTAYLRSYTGVLWSSCSYNNSSISYKYC
jgi:hypothetical protein